MPARWNITEEMAERVRRLIGVEMRPKEVFFNTQATPDAIRHFADGIGDPNPLWRDEDYARRTRYGGIVAPPNFLYSVYLPGGGMPNMGNRLPAHGMFGGNEWNWHLPILAGDSFSYMEKILSVVEKETRAWGKAYRIDSETTFWNQRNEVVAKARGWVFRINRPESQERGKRRPIHQYTQEELRQIKQAYRQERPRGATPRYWEDVQVGEELQPMVKGPLQIQDMIAWTVGAGTIMLRAHGLALEYAAQHRDTVTVDEEASEHHMPELQHTDTSRAQEFGLSAAYDFGHQRVAWLVNLLTHWQGDDGFLTWLYCELREPNQIMDTTWLKGKVVGKETKGEEHLVHIECWGENQLGVVTMPGRATVVLPSRK